MRPTEPVSDSVRWLAVAGGVLVASALVAIVIVNGWDSSRLSLFALIGLVAVGGSVATAYRRPLPAFTAGLLLVLLGFWQAVLGVFVVPAGLVLLFAGLLMWDVSLPSVASSDA